MRIARTALAAQPRGSRCEFLIGSAAAGEGDGVKVEAAGDAHIAGAREPFGEDPLHDGGRRRIGYQTIERRATRAFRRLGAR